MNLSLPLGDVMLWRAYSSSDKTWLANQGTNPLLGVPKPFGRFSDQEASDAPKMRWSHNFYSYVYNQSDLTQKFVRTPWFENPIYSNCAITTGSGGHCPAPSAYKAQTDKLLKLDAGYILVGDEGKLNFYLDRYASSQGVLWFLTQQTDSEGRLLSSVTYGDGGSCPGVSDSGVPYVHTVTAPGMRMGLKFNYVDLPVPGSTKRDCVVSSVDVLQPDGGIGGTVRYSYRNNAAGDLEGVDGGALVEFYNYDGGFGRLRSGTYVSFNPLDATLHALGDHSEGPRFTIDGGYQGGFCETGTCCQTNNQFSRTLTYLNENAGDGTGSGSDPGFKKTYKLAGVGISTHPEQVIARSDTCTSADSCNAGTEYYAWLDSASGGSCGTGAFAGTKNKVGNWFFNKHAFMPPDAGPFASGPGTCNLASSTCSWERYQYLNGVTPNITSNNPLETFNVGFTYSTDYSVQQRARTETDSLLQSGAKAGTFYRYASGTNHLEAMFTYGYTKDLNGASVQRTIGTFYRTTRTCTSGTDSLGRVVAIDGPCDVSGTSATTCTASTFPTTELFYYATSIGTDNAGRLHHVDQYPNGCSSTPLVTTYDAYNAVGDPRSVKDPNDVETRYTYSDAREVTQRLVVGPNWTTNYVWENGELSAIQHPQQNYEVFCHRVSTDCNTPTTTCDPSLPWSKHVQWQAKLDSSQSSWSELTSYCRWPNGALKTKRRYTNNSGYELRAEESFDEDAEGNPSWTRVGSGTGSYTTAKKFDGAGRLTELGLGFNGAPSFCRTSGAPSFLCAWLRYDRANRLSELTTYPDSSNAAGLRSCFDHDARGNMMRVSTGCLSDAGTACNANGGLSTCSTAPSDYVHDDFGNVVEVKLANTDNDAGTAVGVSRYSYDPFGNILVELHPNNTNAYYTYDMLGRLLTVSSYPYEAYTLTYDSATVPSGCTALSNTKGRLHSRSDVLFATYYSYDEEGRVRHEVRTSGAPAACPSPKLDTEYTYSANGNLESIVYPHGRPVEYRYPGSGAAVDRAIQVNVGIYSGSSFSQPTLIDNISWEPYGGLRGYVITHTGSSNTSRVEYMLGGDSSAAPSSPAECSDTAPSVTASYDKTARLRSLRVSYGSTSSLGSGSGELFKRLYTWTGEQVTRMDTCYRDDDLPLTEVAAYDKSQRLTSVSMPNWATSGGWQRGQTYTYDARSNKTNIAIDTLGTSYSLTRTGPSHAPDWLVSEAPNDGYAHHYLRDARGAVSRIATPNTSAAQVGHSFTFTSRAAGNYRAVTLNDTLTSRSFVYQYDAFNRRISKEYPTDVEDRFYYDTGHQLLEDVGNSTTVWPGSPYAIDEYVWLDGRPVVAIRAKFDGNMVRQADGTGTCARNGRNAACDTYFIVTDHIGKPVLSLDSSRRITGVGEYEPFGALNRFESWWGTNWTYGWGAGNSATLLSQRSHGLMTAFRAHFTRFESEQNCVGGFVDGVQTSDNTTSASCGDYSGHLGEVWTNWCSVVSNASGYADYRLNWHTDAFNCAPGTCGCTGVNHQYAGITLRSYEYQRYQADAGASMYFPPLRFPGQYFDEETHLHENWNRHYNPVTGEYLQPEPLLGIVAGARSVGEINRSRAPLQQGGPTFASYLALLGRTAPTYSYAFNNPLAFVDRDGLSPLSVVLPTFFGPPLIVDCQSCRMKALKSNTDCASCGGSSCQDKYSQDLTLCQTYCPWEDTGAGPPPPLVPPGRKDRGPQIYPYPGR